MKGKGIEMESGNRRIVWLRHEDLKPFVVGRSKWCPLFGFIAYPDVSPSSILSRCVDIITESRRLWNMLFLSGCSYESYPHPDKLPSPYDDTYLSPDNTPLFKYPKDELLTARALFEQAFDIMANAQIRDPLRDYDTTGKPSHDFDQLSEDRIMYQVGWRLSGYKGINRNIESYKVFAILAIYEAREALRFIFEDGKTKEDRETLKAVQAATNFLNRARGIKAAIDIKKRDEEIKNIKPLAEKHIKHQNARRATIRRHNIKKSIKGWNELERVLPGIIKKRSDKNNSEIAKALMRHIDFEKEYNMPELNEYKSTWKQSTLRKKIAEIRQTHR